MLGLGAPQPSPTPRALIASLYFPLVCFKALNQPSSVLACGAGLLLLYRGCRCPAGCVFLIGGGFRNRCGDLECRVRSPGTAELSWGQQSSPGRAPSGAATARLLARSRSPLYRV